MCLSSTCNGSYCLVGCLCARLPGVMALVSFFIACENFAGIWDEQFPAYTFLEKRSAGAHSLHCLRPKLHHGGSPSVGTGLQFTLSERGRTSYTAESTTLSKGTCNQLH